MEKRGVRNVSLGGSQSPWKEPLVSNRLLTTFSHMNNHIGENLIELWWHQGEMEFAHKLTPGEKSPFYRDSDSQSNLSLNYKPSAFSHCAVSAP